SPTSGLPPTRRPTASTTASSRSPGPARWSRPSPTTATCRSRSRTTSDEPGGLSGHLPCRRCRAHVPQGRNRVPAGQTPRRGDAQAALRPPRDRACLRPRGRVAVGLERRRHGHLCRGRGRASGREGRVMERVLVGVPSQITMQWSVNGVLADPGAVTISIVNDEGDELATDEATDGTGAVPRTFDLTTTHTAQLDRLVATWTSPSLGVKQEIVEVVGGFI